MHLRHKYLFSLSSHRHSSDRRKSFSLIRLSFRSQLRFIASTRGVISAKLQENTYLHHCLDGMFGSCISFPTQTLLYSGFNCQNASHLAANSQLKPVPGMYNLILIAHPKCPCTAATLEELDKIVARTQGRLAVHAVFYAMHDAEESWFDTKNWHKSASIPALMRHKDYGGAYTTDFGAQTSGQILLYNQENRLVFNGGITAGRGHAGDNVGELSVIEWVQVGHSTVSSTPVFGCHLKNNTVPPRESVDL